MTVGGVCFLLTMVGFCSAVAGRIVEGIPMNSRNTADQQFRSSAHAKFLDFFRAEAGYANFGDPNRQISNGLDLTDALRPFVNLPVLPIQRKAVQGDDIEMIEDAEALHARDEFRIDR